MKNIRNDIYLTDPDTMSYHLRLFNKNLDYSYKHEVYIKTQIPLSFDIRFIPPIENKWRDRKRELRYAEFMSRF